MANNPTLVLENLRPGTFNDPGVYGKLNYLESKSTEIVLSVKDFGAKGDGVTDDTAALQAAIDYAHNLGGLTNAVVYIPASPQPYMFSNLTLWSYTILRGSRMAQSQLKRLASATGNAITEKDAASGNTLGAQSIWISDLGIHGNGTAGNGIDLGFVVNGHNFDTWATLENVFVQNFTAGTGIHVRANAISLHWIYALGNQVGIHAAGAYSQFHTVYAEQNSSYQLRASSTASTFFGVHCEPGNNGDVPAILVEGGAQSFYGVTVFSNFNRTTVISVAAGATKTQFHDVFLDGTMVYTNGILTTDFAISTGTDKHIQHFEMGESSNVASWYANMTSGKVDKRSDDNHVVGGLLGVGLTPGATIRGQVHARAGDSGLTVETPSQVVLENTGANTILSMLNNTNRKKIAFGNSTANNDGAIDYDAISRGMRFITAGAVRGTFDSAGAFLAEQSVTLNNTAGTTLVKGNATFNGTITGPGLRIGTQVLTAASGTYTPTTGTKRVLLRMVGGGGGGGGALGSASGDGYASGGASGAYIEKWIDPGATVTGGAFATGAAGAAGTSTPGNGGAGGDSTVVIQGTTYTAKGGNGGLLMNNVTAVASVKGGDVAAGSTAGDVSYQGQPGGAGFALSITVGVSGAGGSSVFGVGGVGLVAQGTGTSAVGKGSGGGGAASTSTTGQAGGAGTAGLIIIEEYQ